MEKENYSTPAWSVPFLLEVENSCVQPPPDNPATAS